MRIALAGLAAGANPFDIAGQLKLLHPKNDTFPGEVLLDLAADALELGQAGSSWGGDLVAHQRPVRLVALCPGHLHLRRSGTHGGVRGGHVRADRRPARGSSGRGVTA